MKRIRTRPYSFRTSESLRQSGVHPVLARILAARGVSDTSELSSELNKLQQPDALLHIDKAAHFLAEAILRQQSMVVVADYDCDGATACAVAIRGLRAMGARVDYMVPNRFEYGYGLTPEIVALIDEATSPDIIITVDNGIASMAGVKEARQRGMAVLITDHHLPAAVLPEANVIVNPNLPECGFPSKNLAGVGVIFYVLLALRAHLRQRGIFDESTQPRLDTLLDLVALGTVADVVRLDANNRILVAQGLKRIRAGRMQMGIAALYRAAGREFRRASAFDLGFAIGPRLNAAGRMTDMTLGIECLLADDEGRAWELARQLNEINIERREVEIDMQESALASLENFDPRNKSTISLYNDEWHQGIIGLVSSRLKDRFFRPTITFAPAQHGMLRGSGRSIPGFHLRDALDRVSKQSPNLIERFGGHAMAAGLSIRAEAFHAFEDAFENVGRASLDPALLEEVIETDGPLEDPYFSIAFIELLESHVWGQGFPPPLFCDAFRIKSQRILKNKHSKLVLEKNGRSYDAIWFSHTATLPETAMIAYRLDANEFNGTTRVQLVVEHAQAT